MVVPVNVQSKKEKKSSKNCGNLLATAHSPEQENPVYKEMGQIPRNSTSRKAYDLNLGGNTG